MDTKMSLNDIEKELKDLVTKDKNNWTHFYVLLKDVEQHQLWKSNFRSFTAWVKNFCIKTKTNESIIWARKKAGEVYQNYSNIQKEKGIEVEPITKIKVTPDTLVLLEKISRKSPELGADLTEKALTKKIKRKDLREAYRTIKSKTQNSTTKDKNNEDNTDIYAVTATEIVTAMSETEWLGVENIERKYFKTSFNQDKYRVFTEFPVFTGTSKKSRRIDLLVAENITTKEPYGLNLHGIEIKVNKHDLLNDNKYTEYAEFVDFLWLAVPEPLLEYVKDTKPESCGIIVYRFGKVEIVEHAKQLIPMMKHDTLNKIVLKIL